MTIARFFLIVSLVVFFAIPSRAQQSAYHQEVFTQARPGARVAVDGSAYHQVSWVTSGGPGACYVALDYSEDGMVWFLGHLIPIRDCTRSGSSPVAGATVKYVRMNVNSLSGSAAIRATYTGYLQNPGPTGTVTSVFGRTGDVLAVQGDYNVADITGAAPSFSPNFSGRPTAPTPAPGDNSNALATTAWVTAHCTGCGGGQGGGAATGLLFGSTTIPLGTAPTPGQFLMFDGTNIVGGTPSGGAGGAVTSVFGRTGAIAAQANDYNVSQVTGAAPLSSPTFLGIPQAPQPGANDNSAQIATTAFVMAHAGTGGPSLAGCTTPTSGDLVCTSSIQGGTGNVGLLTMPYVSGAAGSGLPSPPAGTHAAIAPDATGHLFWSPGNGTAFTAIGSGGGTVTAGVASFNNRTGPVMPLASDYSAFFAPIGGSTAGPATSLQFGSTVFDHSPTAPANGECLAIDGSTIRGTSCGGPSGGVTIVD